jgi:hypothetical protein
VEKVFKLHIGDFFDNLRIIVAHGLIQMDDKLFRPISAPNSLRLIQKVGGIFSIKYFWVYVWSCGKASNMIRLVPLNKIVNITLGPTLSAFLLELHLLAQMPTYDQKNISTQAIIYDRSQCN